ncbi:MAG: ABC transporter ATP-binding protein [Waddliaceae bacterium]
MKRPFYHRNYEQQLEEKKGADVNIIRRLMGYFKPYRFGLLMAVVLLIAAKGIEAYVPLFIKDLTHAILSSYSLDALQRQALLIPIIYQCFGLIGLLLVAYCFDTATVVLKNWIGQRGLYTLRTELYHHIQQMPIEYYNNHAVGTLMTRTIHDVEQIHQMFAESVVPLFGSLVLFVGIFIGLIIMDWRVALVLAGVLPVVFLLTNHFRINQRRCYDNIRGIVTAMNAFVQEHLMGLATVRSFGLQKLEREQFDEINEDHCTANVETIHYFALFFAGIDFIQSVSLILVFVVLVLAAPLGARFEGGVFFAFSLYVLMLFRPLADLAERYNVLQSAMAAAVRIFGILDRPLENPGPLDGPELDTITSLSFDNVWFAYKDGNWILKGLTFSVKKGEAIALVGVTGAGKTTVLNLILRYYDHQRGSIKINGIDIRAFSVAALRRQFSVVLQDPEIFSGTFADNIRLDHPHITAERLEGVVDYVNLRPLIDRCPEGLQYKLTERGKSLSAGEKQLVSLARAVAHQRSCLLLDEATANIDSHTEKIIRDDLKKILHEKTAIIIAHRLSTIQDVDRIVVLHHGVAEEAGTHRELMKRKGIYEKLYRLQFMDNG